MLRNTADCQADLERFINRVAASETVWYLRSEHGTASCESNDFTADDDGPVTVLLYFSDEAYARRCQNAQFDDHTIESMPLFDFLFRWLPGMSGDGVMAGPNWNHELVGLELDPLELREQIDSALSPAQMATHAERYRSLTQLP
ncbi:uncharacterized protein DUF2750 [Prosthecobacter fusiformis]|uniref:Uncharacterized protein DUF2750 n=2 Tax=Prosthecobacter fusiformis TaxID=48464 RepID=A0A4R7RL44_9BACT|nr:uncharacterized protein DUF2750 [Prosthecobacter fusiformis]